MTSPHEDTVSQFGHVCVALSRQLERDAALSAAEQRLIENCFSMTELCYVAWMHRNKPASPPPPLSTMPSPSGDGSVGTPSRDA